MYSQVVYGDIVSNVFIPAAAQGNFDPTTLGACAAKLVSTPYLERDERPPRALQQPPASVPIASFSSAHLPT